MQIYVNENFWGYYIRVLRVMMATYRSMRIFRMLIFVIIYGSEVIIINFNKYENIKFVIHV